MLLQPEKYSEKLITEYVLKAKKLQNFHGRNFFVFVMTLS